MLYLTVFGTGMIAWKSSRDHRLLVGTQHELLGFKRDRLVEYVDRDPLDLLIT